MTCVSAADNQTDDIATLENDIISEEILTDENDGSFTELKSEISDRETYELTRNYTYNLAQDGLLENILISKDNFVLDGKGHTINYANHNSIMLIEAKNVVLKNINFINHNSEISLVSAVTYGTVATGTITDCNFTNNNGMTGAVVVHSNVVIENCNFINNTASSRGGGITALNASNVIKNCNFENNSVKHLIGDILGGGAVWSTAPINIENCNFNNNSAFSHGGALNLAMGGTVKNSIFTNNRALTHSGIDFSKGGAIYSAILDKFDVENCTFISNFGEQGGAIYTNSDGIIANNTFENNSALFGGAIYVTNFVRPVTIENNKFIKNSATNYGGAIYTPPSAVIKNNEFDSNSAMSGGAIYSTETSGLITIENNNFTKNSVTSHGGAIYFNGAANVTNSSFSDNYAGARGGAILFVERGNVTNCNFTKNGASMNGGALDFFKAGTVESCNFNDNYLQSSGGIGGAINFDFIGNVKKSNFTNNSGPNAGGAIYFSSNGVVEDSIFTGNKANMAYGSTIYFRENGNITRSNFTKNHGLEGTVYFLGNGNVIDSNFNENTAGKYAGIYFTDDGNITRSNFTKNSANGNNIVYFHSNGNVIDSNFNENTAIEYAGIYFESDGNVVNSNFTSNKASGPYSGAVYVSEGKTVNVSGSKFTGNEAYSQGGAILSHGTLNVKESSFEDNRVVNQNGGAIYIANGKIIDCEFINNIARLDGGALYLNGIVEVSSSNFTLNKADRGGAIYSASASCTVNSSTFLNNRASSTSLTASEPSAGNTPEITLTFKGQESFINAIFAPNGITLRNVTYWNGQVVNNEDVTSVRDTYPGINITVEVYSNDVLVDNVTLMTNASSQVTYSSINLDAGNYTLKAYHKGDNYYTAKSSNEVKFTVIKNSSSVEIKIDDGHEFIYGDVCNIPFNVTNRTEVRVVITRDGEVVFNQTVEDDYVNPVLNASDSYNITVYNAANATHSSSKDSKLFKVLPKEITITVTVDNVTYPNQTTVTINGVPGDYIVDINGTEVPITLTADTGFTKISLAGGKYYANATFNNPNYKATIINATFSVYPSDKFDINVNATDDIIYGDNATVNLTFTTDLPNIPEGFVNVSVEGNNFSAPVENGVAILNISGLKPGNYTLEVTYSGNENYTGRTVNVDIHVQKIFIDAADAKYGWANTYEYQAKLVSENGTAVANRTLTFTINNETINATTDSEGIAKINLTSLDVGSFDILIENELTDNVTQKITVLPRIMDNRNMVIDYDSTSFTVTAIGDDGNPISDAIVEMTANGVKYNVKTDKNGVAKLPIELKPGRYTVTSSYKGYVVKNTIRVKYTLKAKKTVNVRKTAKKLVLRATLKWSNGKAIAGKKITFKFKGKKYTVRTNKKGLAKITIKKNVIKKLRKGKTYKAKIIYKNETVTTKVKVKK